MNGIEIISLIYDDSGRRGLSVACSENRHDRNRGNAHGHIGYYLNGRFMENPEVREEFLQYLRGCPLSCSLSIDARFLDDQEILDAIRNSHNVREIRIINDGFVLTSDVLNRFADDVVIVCDEVSDDIALEQRNRVYVQHGLYKKETNFIEDDLVSGYFITHELSDRELDYLVDTVNRDNSADYCQINFRIYDPTQYRDLVTRLHDRGLRDDVRINFLGNPLYDRSETLVGLNEISNNPISITYDTCSDMVTFYTEEPYTVSNMHHSELEGGGKPNFDSYFRMLNVLETQEQHIAEQGYSPLEAAIYVYRFLQQNYAYDPDYRTTDSINTLTNRQLDIVAGNSTMVCEGYATYYSALMRRCGIPMFRYSTDIHVRNIARIVDEKYGVDTIGVCDPTVDGSRIIDGDFNESNRFTYFMFSPREAVYFDPYITIPTSLVLDYEACGEPYLSFLSRDEYENDLSLRYTPDGYAMTMLERMGIRLPEPLTYENYRELVANLNRTSLFTNMDLNAFSQAYEHVLRTENPNMSDFDVTLTVRDGILSMADRLDQIEGFVPLINLNGLYENAYDIPAILYPMENTLSISDFNSMPASENVTGQDVDFDQSNSTAQQDYVEQNTGNTLENNSPSISEEDVNGVIDENMSRIEVNSDEFIPGTNIRKPRCRGDYETDEEYVEYLRDYYGRYFPESVEENRENDTTYRLRQDQIIQDLPIYSTQPSRYTGAMSDEEIEISRGKLR